MQRIDFIELSNGNNKTLRCTMTTLTPFQLFKKTKQKKTKKMIKKVIRVEMFRENLWIFDTGRGTRKGIILKISWD